MKIFKVQSVNISEAKGTVKYPVEQIELTTEGISGDAHSGNWHRQVSLLAEESIRKAEQLAGTSFPSGTFAENITTIGIELHHTTPLDRFICGNVVLEVTQIGKKCHSKCEIGKKTGNCIMPLEGVFCRVVKPGFIKKGDVFNLEKKRYKVLIVGIAEAYQLNGDYANWEKNIIAKTEQFFKNLKLECEISVVKALNEETNILGLCENAVNSKFDLIITSDFLSDYKRDNLIKSLHDFFKASYTDYMELLSQSKKQPNPNSLIDCCTIGAINKTVIYSLPDKINSLTDCMDTFYKHFKQLNYLVNGLEPN